MEIKNKDAYDRIFLDRFGDISKITLSNIKKYRIRIDLGEDLEDESKAKQALKRSNAVLDFCFKGKGIWLQIILWDNDGLTALKNAGMNPDEADKSFEWNEDDYNILYLYYEEYSFQKVLPLALSVINYDLTFTPSANITCYFVDFGEPVIVNIYDDRGCDIYSTNGEFADAVNACFSSWLN
ncbi:DUF3885 domain-containing protein [Sphingobacterium endophyticum]|uniref:DUF3885 domain-containing protein n=1 Tax=Sphingobacterium endophyticum TaxID=2546448 RepID=UPI0012E1478D|nr:hypothetical protein [Sphingobacterium endophyticum]